MRKSRKKRTSGTLAKEIRRAKTFRMRLKRAKAVEIIGAVDPKDAPGGGQFPGFKQWSLSFSFKPWKIVSGMLNEKPLAVSKDVSERTLEEYMDRVNIYDVYRARVRIAQDEKGDFHGTLVRLIRKEKNNKELKKRVGELKKPVLMKDEFFGKLKLDRRFNSYETTIKWRSKRVQLSLSMDECKDVDAFLSMARSFCKAHVSWNKRIEDFAVAKLLNLKNRYWLDDDEEKLSTDQFRRKITPSSLHLDPDGSFTFYFHDGNLFLGHAIQVTGTIKKGPRDADIPG
jgi:hypothetical protein